MLVSRVRSIARSFWFLPTLMTVGGILLAVGALELDAFATDDALPNVLSRIVVDVPTARAVMTTIASSTITVVSLIYSLTLLTFTLAAGNLGPRLLDVFRSSRMSQATVGAFGATFLYALVVLYASDENFVPSLSVLIAILMVTASFYLLISFVQHVSSQLYIDNEVARLAGELQRAVDCRLTDEGEDQAVLPRIGSPTIVLSEGDGYVQDISRTASTELAQEADVFLEFVVRTGDFLVEGQPVARLHGRHEAGLARDVTARTLSLGPTRTRDADLAFALHLLVEIALRALSPGVNDSYTAASCVDNLSAALARMLRKGEPSLIARGDDGRPRVLLPQLGADEAFGVSIDPLRRNAKGNVLVTSHLLDALARIGRVAAPTHAPLVRLHAGRILQDARDAGLGEHDLDVLEDGYQRVENALRDAARARGADARAETAGWEDRA